MKKLTTIAVVLACALALNAAPAAADARSDCAGVDAAYSAPNIAALRTAVVCLTNRERIARGMPPLAEESHLTEAAQGHSEDMARNNYFDHTDLSGGKPWDRTKAAGYASGWVGENIAAGYPTPFDVMTGWMKSSGHCSNILNSPYVDIGIGVTREAGSKYGIYWTMVLGGHNSSAPTVTVSCPAAGLAAGSIPVSTTPAAGGAAKATITSVKRRSGGRYRVKGAISPAASGRRVKLTVRRGKKTRTYTVTTGASGSFSRIVRAPRGTGKVRVAATLPN